MKKLMIAVAIVCATAMSQAASLNWQTWGFINDGSADSDWITGGQAYLVMVTDVGNFSVANDLTVTGGSIVDSMSFADGTANGTWTGTDSLVDGTTYQFAMILTSAGDGAEVPTTGFFGVDEGPYEVTWSSATGGSFIPEHEGISISTQVVPEPTSGLLLLLGMAGLALKRKRA